jgi:hypothetical protein
LLSCTCVLQPKLIHCYHTSSLLPGHLLLSFSFSGGKCFLSVFFIIFSLLSISFIFWKNNLRFFCISLIHFSQFHFCGFLIPVYILIDPALFIYTFPTHTHPFVVLRIEPGAWGMLSKHFTTKLYPQPPSHPHTYTILPSGFVLFCF